jgi:hypothetical protein
MKRRVILILALLFAVNGAYWLSWHFKIDKCLDLGGRWQNQLGFCEK